MLEGSLVAVAYRNMILGIHDNPVAFYLLHTVHIYNVGTVYLEKIGCKTLLYRGK